VKWCEIKCTAVKWGKSENRWRVFMVGEEKWREGPVKIDVLYLWGNNIRNWLQYFLPIMLLFVMCIAANCSWSFVYCVIILCVSLWPHVYCFTVCVLLSYIPQLPGLLARSQYLEIPATCHLGTGFSWFTWVYKRMLGWFPRLQVAIAMLLM